MNQIVRRIKIQHDPLWRFLIRIQQDLLVSLFVFQRSLVQLKPVQRALPSQRLSSISLSCPALSARILFSHQYCQQWIVPQIIVVIQIFISKRYPIYSLRYQLLYRMLDCPRVSIVCEAFRESPDDPSSLFYFSQQQSATIACNLSTGEVRYHRSASQGLKLVIFEVTLCTQEAVPFFRPKLF